MWTTALLFLKGLSWQTYVVIALGLAAAGIYAEKTGHIDLLEHELASMTTKRDGLQIAIDDAEALGTKTAAANKAIETQRVNDQKEDANEAQRMSIRARDDSSSVGVALGKLLDRATVASSGQTASNPSAVSASAATEGAGLRPNLLGSIGSEAQLYAAIADAARIRGAHCESDYDTLRPIESERGDDD